MICLLDKEVMGFPDPRDGDPDGLFAVGGDLSTERLLIAYSNGIFPWYAYRAEDTSPAWLDDEGKPYIQWWCPMDRFVIFTDEVHVSHSMRTELNKIETGERVVTLNKDFEQLIDLCGKTRDHVEGAWLGPEIKAAYTELHKQGWAHSVEVWDRDGNLIGGLYGELVGNIFCGESMVSLKPNASKLALIVLSHILSDMGIKVIDCQLETAHLKSMGGRHITYDEYMKLIEG